MFYIFLGLGASLIAASNYFIRRSVDIGGGEGDPFLFLRLFMSGLIISLTIYLMNGSVLLDLKMLSLGAVAGLLLGLLMWLTGRSLKFGGSGISFAAINSACMAPPLLMALFFGQAFGHTYSFSNAIGASLIIAGLFISANREKSGGIKKPWYFWIGLTFAAHAIYLTYFQWRALLLKSDIPGSMFIPFQCRPDSADCFGIAMFAIAAVLQFILPSNNKTKFFSMNSTKFGVGGGIINGLGAFAMLKATEAALGFEKGLLFPLNSSLVIILCSLWGSWIFKEAISWTGLALIAGGIIVSFL